MLTYYRIKNFKSLKDVSFAPTNLNLMLGLNSMGKSSVIQSLLMLRQSYYKYKNLEKLLVKDDAGLVSLGKSQDVFFQNAAEDEKIEYELNFENKNNVLAYSYKNNLEYFSLDNSKLNSLFDESLFNPNFHFLQADHIQPSLVYNKADLSLQEINILGNTGENAPAYLALYGRNKLEIEALHHPASRSTSLATELDAWMGVISPGVKVIAEDIGDVQMVKLGFRFETKNENTNQFSPLNVGFGIPYVLPLVLTILISKPGDLVVVENPESHLHPRGQSELGKLLALAAQAGVQIFCETHSDHIINGVRLAVHNKSNGENGIDSDKVKVFYFDKPDENHLETSVSTIYVDSNGELSDYPKGLLDEWGNVLSQLF